VLVELRVRNLGVIDDVRIDLGPGMTAVTGETGAGKTLLVEALELLLGSRADSTLVRPGAEEALVEGRFLDGGREVILARAVAAQGRSRAWVDGRMAPVAALAETGGGLVDLHGQHAHQSLLDPAAQRRALDRSAGIDPRPVDEARAALRDVEAELDALGGDARVRAREADLLRYQLEEIEQAEIVDPEEDERLAAEEDGLAQAATRREAARVALATLVGEDEAPGVEAVAIVDRLGDAAAQLGSGAGVATLRERLLALQAEAGDVAGELRDVVERWEEDPERLEAVRARRQLLRELCRKYGATPAEVIDFGREAARRLAQLDALDTDADELQHRRDEAAAALAAARAELAAARRAAAPGLAASVQDRLRSLAMARARLSIDVSPDGADVAIGLGANPGEPVLPLAKVASGGELARTMLALRLVLSDAPPTMVFDEVDAGIGGEAALSVGRALSELARGHQVLVVTHLAQVAAFAGRQLAVRKEVVASRTRARVAELDREDRAVELARMLSGRPDSDTARRHAEELLREATPTTRKGRRRVAS
jgi:DNA repair protein RecN (Recombination protein N)